MELSDREDNAEGEESFERNGDMEENEESMLVAYETLAPEMRPESGSNGKSVKWHRLDYYEIAPLNDPSEAQKGVLSRGGLMRRTAKRLRSENPVVQLAALHRCAADFHFLVEGPCLRPLLEAVRDLAGHGKPTTPSTPTAIGGSGGFNGRAPVPAAATESKKPNPPGSANQGRGRMPRDEYNYGPNLVAALRTLVAFMKDNKQDIPEGILERAGESALDGQAADDSVVDKKRRLAPSATAVKGATADEDAPGATTNDEDAPFDENGAEAAAAAGGSQSGSVGGGTSLNGDAAEAREEEERLEQERLEELERVHRKKVLKRAKLIAKEMQRKKTMFESSDLVLLLASPRSNVADASLMLFESLTTALRDLDELGGDASTAFPAQPSMVSQFAAGSVDLENTESSRPGTANGKPVQSDKSLARQSIASPRSLRGGGNQSVAPSGYGPSVIRSVTPSRAAEAAKGALLRMLANKGNPAAAVAALLPRVRDWREAASEQAARRAEIEARIAGIEANSKAAAAAAKTAAEVVKEVASRCEEAKDPGGKLKASAKGNKPPKFKPIPPELSEELAECESKAEELADVAQEALEAFEQAKAEIGSGSGEDNGAEGGEEAAASWKNDAILGQSELEPLVTRALSMMKFLWEEVGDHALLQLVQVIPSAVPSLLTFLLEDPFSNATRVLLHALSRPDVPLGCAALVLSGGSGPVIELLEKQVAVCEPLKAQDHDLDPMPLQVLIEVVEIVTAMASCDRQAIASNPEALQLYPSIPCLSHMLDLDLSHADAVALNTAVFSALSALGLRSPEGRLQVCQQGAMQLLVKFVVASNEDAAVNAPKSLQIKERNLRRTADKALLHLVYCAADVVDPKVLSGKQPYLPTKSILEALEETFDNGRRRVCRLVATLASESSNAAALGAGAVPALTASVGKWRDVLTAIEEADDLRQEQAAIEEATAAKAAAAATAAGRGLPASVGLLNVKGGGATSGGGGALTSQRLALATEEEGDEEPNEDDSNNGENEDEIDDSDITEVDGLGEVLYALQALGQLTRMGGDKVASAVGSDELVEMLVEMLFECGRRDGSEVDHRLCVITDLSWEFEPNAGEDLSVEFRVLRAEAVNLLTNLAHVPATAPRVARHAGLALKMVAGAYGCFTPGLRSAVMPRPPPLREGASAAAIEKAAKEASKAQPVAAWQLVLDTRAGQPKKASALDAASSDKKKEGDESANATKTSPQLMLALLRLIEKLATVPGGREGLYLAACKSCRDADVKASSSGSVTKDDDLLPVFFTAPRADVSIGNLVLNAAPEANAASSSSVPPALATLTSERSFSMSGTEDGGWEEGSAPLVEAPPSYATFRPCALVLMALLGALSGGTTDVEQLRSALRTFTALCREDNPPPPVGSSSSSQAGSIASKGSNKGNSSATKSGSNAPGTVIDADGNQPVLADTFSATAVRLGALVSLMFLPQSMPVVAGAWGVISEACDLALYLVNRGQVREQLWKSLPGPNSGGGGGGVGNSSVGSRGSQPNSRQGDAMKPPPSSKGGKLGSQPNSRDRSLADDNDIEDQGVPDPNKGPNIAQWAPLLNVPAFVQPPSGISANPSATAPPMGSDALTSPNAMGSYWVPLLAAIGSTPTWSPHKIELEVNGDGTYPKDCEGGHIEVVAQARVTEKEENSNEKASMMMFEVEVTLMQAMNLPNADMLDKSDPQVIIKDSSGATLATSRVVQNALHPVYDETLRFTVTTTQQNDGLFLEVWDYDLSDPTLMCRGPLPLQLPGVNDGTQPGGSGVLMVSAAQAAAARQADMIVEALLSNGADPELCDANGRTSLMHALALANDKASLLLLDQGANVNARDRDGRTLLQYAFSCPKVIETRRALRDLIPGNKTFASDPSSSSSGAAVLSQANNTNNYKAGKPTPLNLEGDCRMVAHVLQSGADPNEADDLIGDFGLHMALHGTSFTFQLPIGPRGVPRPLQLKVQPDGLQALLASQRCVNEGEADVNACNRAGETALHLLVSEGHASALLELLLEQGADPNLLDSRGELAVHRFARHVTPEAPAMLARLLRVSKGKILRPAVFSNERRALSAEAKMDLAVNALFDNCASELECPAAVAAPTTSVDDILAAPTAEGWSLTHCLCGAAVYDAATAAAYKGTTYDTLAVLEASGDAASFQPMLSAALDQSGDSKAPAQLAHPRNGLTPLHLVCRVFGGQVALNMAECLLKQGADANAIADLPPHPLLGGSKGLSGRAKAAKASTGKGGVPSGWVGPCLSLAVAYLHAEPTARHLLTSGFAHPCPPGASPTPLHVACAVGASPATIAALLAASGGGQALAMQVMEGEASSSLGGMAVRSSLGEEELMQDGGAGEEVKDENSVSSSASVKSSKSKKSSKSSSSSKGSPEIVRERPGLSGTPLHAAAAQGLCAPNDDNEAEEKVAVVVEQLLACEQWVKPEARDALGRTALQIACMCGKDIATQALLKHALRVPPGVADDETQSGDLAMSVDYGGKTALHHAIDSGASCVVQHLITSHDGLASLVTKGRTTDLGNGGMDLKEDDENENDDDASSTADELPNGEAAAAAGGSAMALTSEPPTPKVTLSEWVPGPGVSPPANALEYAEHVQLLALRPCRLVSPDNPFGHTANGESSAGKSSKGDASSSGKLKKGNNSMGLLPMEEDIKGSMKPSKKSALKSSSSMPSSSSSSKGNKGSSSSAKAKKETQVDYGAWRRGFRSEFALLTSSSAIDMDLGVRLLMRHASGLSADVPSPPKPSPSRSYSSQMYDLAAMDAQGGGDPLSGATSPGQLQSMSSVDSWEASAGSPNATIGGMATAKSIATHASKTCANHPGAPALNTVIVPPLDPKVLAAEAAERFELSQLWSEALSYVTHASEAYARGSTELAERWASLGSTAAVVIQALVRRVQGALKVKKLRERLRLRRMNQARNNNSRGRSGPPSRVSMSSRGSVRSGQNSARGGQMSSRQGSARGQSRDRGNRRASPGRRSGGGL